MHQFSSILLVLDPKVANEEALARAVNLAKDGEAKLTVVNVGHEAERDISAPRRDPRPFDMHEIAHRARQQELQDFLAPVQQAGIDVHCQALPGLPYLEITRTVMREKHDLVITTVPSMTGSWARTRDRTAQHLIRNCPCPVWVFKPRRVACLTRILVAVDVSPDSADSQRDALNVKVMDLATSLTQQDKSELHVVQAWILPAEKYLRAGWLSLARELPAWFLERQNAYQQPLKKLLRKYESTNPDLKIHLPHGEPSAVIPPLARTEQIDLIVLGAMRPAGVARFFAGSTAEAVLRNVDCSVLAVKPESHVSSSYPERCRHSPPDAISV